MLKYGKFRLIMGVGVSEWRIRSSENKSRIWKYIGGFKFVLEESLV